MSIENQTPKNKTPLLLSSASKKIILLVLSSLYILYSGA